MALFGTGSGTQYWRTPLTSWPDAGPRPLWFSVWTKAPNTSQAGLLQLWNSGSSNPIFGLYVQAGGSGTILVRNNAGTLSQMGVGSASTTAWDHIFGQEVAANSRAVCMNGGTLTVDTSSIPTPITFDSLQIGNLTGAPLLTTRSIAEVVVGFGLLSAAQIAALAAGANPLSVAPRQILHYFPLRGDLADLGPRRTGLVPIGAPATVWTEHPRVALPPRRRLFFQAAATPPPTSRRPRIFFIS